MSDHVCTHHLPRLCGASHIDAFWMVRPFSQELQLWLLHALHAPPSCVCLPCFIQMHFLHGGSTPLGSLACCTFYYTDEASRLLADTTKKADMQGLSIPTAAGVVVERGSEYILAHTGPRELDGHTLGVGVGAGV